MFERSWVKAGKAKSLMLFGGSITILALAATLYLWVFGLRPLAGTAILYYSALIVGPLLFVTGMLGWLYNRTSSKRKQLSVRILEGYPAKDLIVLKSEALRIGRDGEGNNMLSLKAKEAPESYWLITIKKGDWLLQHVSGNLKAEVNGQAVSESTTIYPGDQVRVGTVHCIFDTVQNNRA